MSATRAVREDQHGTSTGYAYGCRCAECRAAERSYRADPTYGVSDTVLSKVLDVLEHEADMDGIATVSSYRLEELTGVDQTHCSQAKRALMEQGLIRDAGRVGKTPAVLVVSLA